MRLVVCLSVAESFASILAERGIFFFASGDLRFSDTANLWLAMLFGGTYVAGAVLSYRCAIAVGERLLLMILIALRVLILAVFAAFPQPVLVFIVAALLGGISGLKWPIVESYVAAGRNPAQALRAIGTFNVAWATAGPIAMVAMGWLLAFFSAGLFAYAAGLHVVGVLLAARLSARPAYLHDDHPARPSRAERDNQASLVAASRWLMLLSYVICWIIAPLAPGIFGRLGFERAVATGMASVMDWARLLAFIVLPLMGWWHGRRSPLMVSMLAMPIGLFMIILGNDTTTVVFGQVLCGLAAGMVYYAALYYAMIVHNASVEAGGGHEGVIGLGFVFGPIAGLLGGVLGTALGSNTAGMIAGIAPVLLACGIGACLRFRKMNTVKR